MLRSLIFTALLEHDRAEFGALDLDETAKVIDQFVLRYAAQQPKPANLYTWVRTQLDLIENADPEPGRLLRLTAA